MKYSGYHWMDFLAYYCFYLYTSPFYKSSSNSESHFFTSILSNLNPKTEISSVCS